MQRLSINPLNPAAEAIGQAVAVLRAGGLVALPTETVYGLAAQGLVASAIERIFAAKGRPGWNPLILHVADRSMAQNLVVDGWDARADALADAFWPGPLTLVLPRKPGVPASASAGLPTVAVRMPAHPVALAVIRALGQPVAAPSANRFTHISPTTADHVVRSLGAAVDLILDAGPCSVGVESTVVDLTCTPAIMLRAGGVTLADLQRVLPGTGVAPPPDAQQRAHASPGQALRHYAPAAQVLLVPHGDTGALQAACGRLPQPVGAVLFGLPSVQGLAHVHRLPVEVEAAQSVLYAALHALEDAGCQGMVLEAPPLGGAWSALLDRMTRASRPAVQP